MPGDDSPAASIPSGNEPLVPRSGHEAGSLLDRLARGERESVAERLRSALEAAHANSDGEALDAAMAGMDAILEGRNAVREGRVAALTAHARAAAERIPPALSWLAMYAGSLLQAAFRFSGDPALRDDALAALRRVADRVDDPEAAVAARAMMGSVHLLAGAYHATLQLCDAALDFARSAGLEDTPAAALAHQFRGYVLFEWNRLDEAESSLRRAWSAGEGSSGVRSGVARVLAGLAGARGQRGEADLWLERLESIVAEPRTLRNREWLMAVRVRHSIGTGDLHAVDDWLRAWDYRPETLQGEDEAHLASRLQELDGVLALLEATQRWSDVLVVAPLVHSVARDRRRWFDARALSSWAVALESLGRREEAATRWADALLAGEHGSFARLYVEGSAVRVDLLRRAASAPSPVAGARRVMAALPELAEPAPPEAGLTGRQLEVLRLVDRGLSNKSIARELDLSMSTVKTHLRSAFARLDAGSRTQALARARELGLL
jgi:LuxR family maltose regulon positive regulatory protein